MLLLTGGLLLGWLVLAATMDRVFERQAPSLALLWNPRSADGASQWGDQLLQAQPAHPDPRIGALAAQSLTRQPVNPAAARLLAVVASQHGDEAAAQRLLAYAETMSRRDLMTQVMLIESNVARGDVIGTLLHYNRALESSDGARALLFPILAKAADAPAVWRPLVRLLATRPQWGRDFLLRYVPGANSSDALYAVARALGMDRVPSSDPWVLQSIEKRLVDLGAFAQAAALYNRAHNLPAGDRTAVRNGNFEQPGNWDPFDWNLVDEQDLAAVRQPSPINGHGLALFLSAMNGRGGELAVQLTILPPGRYGIDLTVGGVHGDPVAFPQLAVRCVRDGREFLQAPFPPAPDSGRRWHLTMAIPSDCAAERLILRAAGTMATDPATPWVDDMSITRQADR